MLSKSHFLFVAQLLLKREPVVRPVATTAATVSARLFEDFTQAACEARVGEDVVRIHVRLRSELRNERVAARPARNHLLRTFIVFAVTTTVRRNRIRLDRRAAVRRRRCEIRLEDGTSRGSRGGRLRLRVTVDRRLRIFEQTSSLFCFARRGRGETRLRTRSLRGSRRRLLDNLTHCLLYTSPSPRDPL